MRNKDYKIVVELQRKSLGAVMARVRIAVGVHSLAKYIGEKRANYITLKMQKLKVDKYRFSVQGKAIVDVYLY